MNPKALIERLEANQAVLAHLVNEVSGEQARWRPAPDKWSLLEVVCHLLDEEREDFRHRLQSTLADPATPWPGIDPPGWVTERKYAERELLPVFSEFLAERDRSLGWLGILPDPYPAWDNAYEHPSLGVIRAGDLLASWVAHDLLHIRQIAGLHFAWAARAAEPFTPDYAGEW